MRSFSTMEQYAFHVQRRLARMPSTVNFFHSTISDRILFSVGRVYSTTKPNCSLTSTPPLSTLLNDSAGFSSTRPITLSPPPQFVFRPVPRIPHSPSSSKTPSSTRSSIHSAVAQTRSPRLRFLFHSGSLSMQSGLILT